MIRLTKEAHDEIKRYLNKPTTEEINKREKFLANIKEKTINNKEYLKKLESRLKSIK